MMSVQGGVQKKKSCNIVTTYVGGRTGNYTKFIYFFHGPNSSKSAKKFFFVKWLGYYFIFWNNDYEKNDK